MFPLLLVLMNVDNLDYLEKSLCGLSISFPLFYAKSYLLLSRKLYLPELPETTGDDVLLLEFYIDKLRLWWSLPGKLIYNSLAYYVIILGGLSLYKLSIV